MLDPTPRVVGIDCGTKRVGIAVADPLQLFARVEGTYAPDEALAVLERLKVTDGLEALVIGWPLTLAGEEGAATDVVAAYIARIRERLPAVPIHKRDERFTSELAKQALQEAGVRQPGRRDKGRVDAAAAAIILQDYLDAG
ncbi:Holliday junction resolvase RuvX [Salisaeta longa]|uniref:Holliday junction resolvase RuvX n=1 Tax=Salisaeta longa TaxID=503170 RepID=UPI0003B70F6C|nr:Holliday junction resolvase RuvX [Salisaeta longa]